MSGDAPPDVLAVESNWILDIALHQDEASETLLAQTEQGLVQLRLPSFCIAESIKRFGAIRQQWTELEREIKAATREILRSPQLRFAGERLVAATDALAEVSDAAEPEFWRVIERITRAAALLEPTPETVASHGTNPNVPRARRGGRLCPGDRGDRAARWQVPQIHVTRP